MNSGVNNNPRRFVFGLVLVSIVACFGCKNDHPTTYPVSGILHFTDGKPVSDVVVEFESTESSPAVTARGKTDAAGRFRLSTYSIDDGAVVGQHQIKVFSKDPSLVVTQKEERIKKEQQVLLHPKYARAKSSGLKREVKAENNEFQFELEYQ